MSKTTKGQQATKAPPEPLTQIEVGELIIPVVESYDDLPFDAVIKLNDMSLDMADKYMGIAESGQKTASRELFHDALAYVRAYTEAIGQPIDFDSLKEKHKAVRDMPQAYMQLVTHFNRSAKVDGDAAPVDVGEGKNE